MEAAENMKQGPEGEAAEKIVKWGLPLEELYALALLFYRGKVPFNANLVAPDRIFIF